MSEEEMIQEESTSLDADAAVTERPWSGAIPDGRVVIVVDDIGPVCQGIVTG
jgi:hypothetical protein